MINESANKNSSHESRVQTAHLRDTAEDIAKNVKELAKQTAQSAIEYGEHAYAQLGQATKGKADELKNQIKGNPLTALALAIGAGFLLGSLYRRS